MAVTPNGPMLSEVSICNQALHWLGQNKITSFEDQSTTAELCRDNYPILRDTLLESCHWVFATARDKSETQNRDEFDVAFSHTMPLGWLAVYQVYDLIRSSDPASWRPDRSWRREGEFILSNSELVYMRGTVRVTDTGKFTSLFSQALAARIALDLCIPITNNLKLQGSMAELFAIKLAEAKTGDGVQGRSDVIQSNRYIDARASGGLFDGV